MTRTSNWYCPVCGCTFATTDQLKKDKEGRVVCPSCGSARYYPNRKEENYGLFPAANRQPDSVTDGR